MKLFIKKHYLAILMAIVVGLIYIAPNIFFIFSLGEEYKGIPMMQMANEDYYMARIQEILDGHLSVASHGFYEYKDQLPTAPPTGEYFYALPSIIFGVSPVNTLIASRFILLFILFLLVYFLIKKLTDSADLFSGKINAIAGAFFVTLGYDLVDYRGVFNFLAGGDFMNSNFLIWSRPVNPILGAVFLMSFLILIWLIVSKAKRQKAYIIGASILFALMIGSYFFSWGLALSIIAMLVLIYLFKKEFKVVKNLVSVILLTFVLAIPYWYLLWRSSLSEWYEDSLLRSGMFYTHYPLLNKLMLAVLVLYIILVLFQIWKHRKSQLDLTQKESRFHLQDWHLFCLALILGSLWAYSQQIITGKTVWPYHFTQYTIPFAIIVLMVLFYNIIKKESLYLWRGGVLIIISASLAVGIYNQINTYQNVYSLYAERQSYVQIFDWLNDKKKDCVVLVRKNSREELKIDGLIPAFTHCNTYTSSWVYTLMPNERPQFNYKVILRLNGVLGDEIDQYMIDNKGEENGYLLSNWKGLYNMKEFPDFSDPLLEERSARFPDEYKEFIKKDFRAELETYRIDYVLSINPLAEGVIASLDGLKKVFEADNIYIYSF